MIKKSYRHLFFDLDKTLWDFETNSQETLRDIYSRYRLHEKGIGSFEIFFDTYSRYNEKLWDLYRRNSIAKELLRVKRFTLTLNDFGITNGNLDRDLSHDYVTLSPEKTGLFPGTLSTLDVLKGKYHLHIITNGFEEVQHKKLRHSGLRDYFTEVITSEDAGVTKPEPGIFSYALSRAGARAGESLMIGDDEAVDIGGARASGIDQVLVDYNNEFPDTEATYRIAKLSELLDLL